MQFRLNLKDKVLSIRKIFNCNAEAFHFRCEKINVSFAYRDTSVVLQIQMG